MSLPRRPAERLALDDLDALLFYWRRLSREQPGGPAPDRRTLDPAALPAALLPRLKIVEREPDGAWRYRLVGTGFRDLAGLELSGRRLTDIEAPVYAAHLTRLLDAAAAEGRPVFGDARYLGPGRAVHRRVARLLTPFMRDGTVDTVVVGARWRDMTADPVTSVSMVDVETDRPAVIVEPEEAG